MPKNVCIFIFVRLFSCLAFSLTFFFCMFATPGGYLKHLLFLAADALRIDDGNNDKAGW